MDGDSNMKTAQERDKEMSSAVVIAMMGGPFRAFLGSILCSAKTNWCTRSSTAYTDGLNLYFNPKYWDSMEREDHVALVLHEVWHIGLLHILRRSHRDPDMWNIACDIYIDTMLFNQGYSPKHLYFADKTHKFTDMSAEQIYEEIKNDPQYKKNMPKGFGKDLMESDKQDLLNQEAFAKVQAASVRAALSAGKLPGELTDIFDNFLNPKVPWEEQLIDYIKPGLSEERSYQRPNRRHVCRNEYRPSNYNPSSDVDDVVAFLDVSYSVWGKKENIISILSELLFISEELNAEIKILPFDTQLKEPIDITDSTQFDSIKLTGGGGTDLSPVHKYIQETSPKFVIIFTDLYCDPIERIDVDTDVIWVCVNNPEATVPYGKLIHLPIGDI